jgi:peptidyl-prolyl cis-trans isomerase SurA
MFKRIVVLCVFSFIQSLAQASQLLDKVVAVVNNSVITASELDAQVELSKKQILAQHQALPKDTVLRKQVLQHLIDVDLQLQTAKQNGISVDSTELNQAIERIANTNHIDLTKLREEITKQGISWPEYRRTIRKEMIIARLQQSAVGKEITVSNEQVEQYLKTDSPIANNDVTYHLQHIVIPLNEEPTSDQVKKARATAEHLVTKIKQGEDFNRLVTEQSYDEVVLEGGDLGERHLAELPELFAKEVLLMKVGQVAGPIRAANGFQLIKLVALGGENQKHVVTITHVRHILLKQDSSTLPSDVLKQANNIYQQVLAGKDFSSMAKKYSADSASAVKGGDLGWVNPGELVPEFEKTMNDLAINKLSKPVKTQFGWHLIQVLGRQQKDDSIAFKKQQIRQFLQQRKFTEAVQNWQQHLRSEAYVNVLDKDLA